MCAIFTPRVYLDENNKLKNMFPEIIRCNKMVCNFCGFLGGGLGCCIPGCK